MKRAAPSPIKVLVCGAREWTDRETTRTWLSRLPAGSIVIHGGQRGADSIAGEVAAELGFAVRAYPVDTEIDGPWPGAGPRRNQRMLDTEHVTMPILGTPHPAVITLARCFAFTWIAQGKKDMTPGTADMVSRCIDAGVACVVVPPGARP